MKRTASLNYPSNRNLLSRIFLGISIFALKACGGGETTSSNADTLLTPNEDPISGTDSRETLIGTNNQDQIFGLGGNDLIHSLGGDDYIDAGEGDDIIYSGDGDDTIYGGAGNDILSPGSGNDFAHGGPGNDIIYLSSGDDIEDGGDGIDTVRIGIQESNAAITIDLFLGQYYLTVQGQPPSINLINIENIESVSTSDLTIFDTPENNNINTAGGNDHIFLSGGVDHIEAGDGDDIVTLSNFSDADIHLGSGNDEVVMALTARTQIDGGTGIDTIKFVNIIGAMPVYVNLAEGFYFYEGYNSSQDGADVLLSNIENVVNESNLSITVIGSDANNILVGSTGIDYINGGGGADTITGGAGADTITGGLGADTIVFTTSASTDTVTDFATTVDGINISVGGIDIDGVLAALLAADADGVDGSEAALADDFLVVANAAALTGGSVAAATNTEVLVYITATGALYVNTDGAVADGFVQIADFGAGTTLVVGDVSYIA